MARNATFKSRLTALAVGAPLLSVGLIGLGAGPAAAATVGDSVDLIESTDAYLSPDSSAEAEGQIQPGLGYVIVELDAGNGFTAIAYQEDPDKVFYVETSALDIDAAGNDNGGNGGGNGGENGSADNGGNGGGNGGENGSAGNGGGANGSGSNGGENGSAGNGAEGEGGNGGSGNEADDADVIEAFIEVSQGSVAPGEDLVITGAGFDAEESVYISLGSEYPAFITINSDDSGLIDYSITIPSDVVEGEYEVIAEGADSGISVSTTLTIVSPDAENADGEASAEDGSVEADDRENRDGFVESDENEGDPTEIEAGFVGGDNSNPAALGGLLLGSVLVAGGAAVALRRKDSLVNSDNN